MLSPVHVAHSKIVVLESQVTRDRMSTAMSIHTNKEARKVVPHTVRNNEARKVRLDLILEIAPPQWQ